MSLQILCITARIDGFGGVQKVQIAKWNYWTEIFKHKITAFITNNLQHEIVYPLHPNIKIIEQHPEGKSLNYILNYRKLVTETILKTNPDLIIVSDNGYKAFLLPFFVPKGIPIFFESHGAIYTPEFKMPPLKRWFHKKISVIYKQFLIKNFKGIISLTHKNANEFKHKNSFVIANPLLIKTTKATVLKSKTVLVIGRNSYEKGYDLLLQIWKKVIIKHPDWKLELYTTENPTIDLKKISKNLNIEKNINFHETTLSIIEQIIQSSIHLLPSRTEGFGLVIIETMFYGLPTIAFDCPVGPGEIITNNLDGILIKPYSIEQFAEKICYLIEHPEVRNQLGKNAQETAKKYDIATIMKQWDLFFKQL